MKEGSKYKYASKAEPLLNKYIESFIQEKTSKDLELAYLITRDVKGIEISIENAMVNRETGVIIGEAGTGKSRTIKEYAAKTGGGASCFLKLQQKLLKECF